MLHQGQQGGFGTPHVFEKTINDDLLVQIFYFYRLDNISPNTYPRNWWYTLAHVCQRWRHVFFSAPAHLGITLVCNSRTPVADFLANSPPLPLIIYWGNPGIFDKNETAKNVCLALEHRDRVRRMTLHMPEVSLRKVFSSMNGSFPMLETLQLCCTSDRNPRYGATKKLPLPSMFEAPNLRHLQLSDLAFLPQSTKLLSSVATTGRPSIATFSLGEITTTPAILMESLALMPHLKVLKLGVFFAIPSNRSESTERMGRDSSTGKTKLASLDFTNLEEFEFRGTSDYLEALAARISAPFLKKLFITISDSIDSRDFDHDTDSSTFKYLSQLTNGVADLAFQFARVRFKDGFSIVMDHNELWTGRGAFELKFNHGGYHFDTDIGLTAKTCRTLVPMPSAVEQLLLEDGHRNKWGKEPTRKGWHDLLRVFDNVKTLRVAGRFVEELDKALKPDGGSKDDDGSSVLTLLPRLEEIVRYGPENEFAAFVEARQGAGLPVRIVSGPKNRLTLV